MTFITDIAAKAKESLVGGQLGAAADPGASAIMGVLANQPGGVAGLLGRLDAAGLKQQVASWMGSGAQLPISTDQVSKLLGPDTLKAIATKLGVDPAKAATAVAQALPGIVKQLAPTLSGFAGKFLG